MLLVKKNKLKCLRFNFVTFFYVSIQRSFLYGGKYSQKMDQTSPLKVVEWNDGTCHSHLYYLKLI